MTSQAPSTGIDPSAIKDVLRSDRHFPVLGGIRGIAILLVAVYHTFLYGGIKPIGTVDRAFYGLSMFCQAGVDLSFVLSGFLITGILYDARGSETYFKNFYIRRSLRIFPLYCGFLVFFFLILPFFMPLNLQFQSLQKEQIWYWMYLVNYESPIPKLKARFPYHKMPMPVNAFPPPKQSNHV